ncbi:MAG TPA: 2-C-methyl-D-erythritol 4-phosphate cytidylyltransferase, partial [Planctomycetaceae bacterium]|nr:2-C-methyl-D-erythritol 4-phosphate cytidylyltransferase [Planctomycetaceae bacterium]
MADYAVILAAAGKSSRFRDKHYKKPFAPLANKAVWLHSAEKFLARKDVRQVLIAVAEDDLQWFQEKFAANLMILGVDVIRGGRTRAETVSRALAHVTESVDFIAVHDAARPCLAEVWIDELFSAAVEHGAVIPAIPVTETLKRVDKDHRVLETVSREGLWRAQTPQVFRADWLKEAHAQ